MVDGRVTGPETQRAGHYSLSVQDFQRVPQELTQYRDGDKVTRENFIPFLINTFAVGRGMANCQRTYIDWVYQNEGFDTMSAIKSFRETGGEAVLTEEEKSTIAKAFTQVKKHNTGKDEIEYSVFAFLQSVRLAPGLPERLDVGDLKHISRNELLIRIKEEYERRHESLIS